MRGNKKKTQNRRDDCDNVGDFLRCILFHLLLFSVLLLLLLLLLWRYSVLSIFFSLHTRSVGLSVCSQSAFDITLYVCFLCVYKIYRDEWKCLTHTYTVSISLLLCIMQTQKKLILWQNQIKFDPSARMFTSWLSTTPKNREYFQSPKSIRIHTNIMWLRIRTRSVNCTHWHTNILYRPLYLNGLNMHTVSVSVRCAHLAHVVCWCIG